MSMWELLSIQGVRCVDAWCDARASLPLLMARAYARLCASPLQTMSKVQPTMAAKAKDFAYGLPGAYSAMDRRFGYGRNYY